MAIFDKFKRKDKTKTSSPNGSGKETEEILAPEVEETQDEISKALAKLQQFQKQTQEEEKCGC